MGISHRISLLSFYPSYQRELEGEKYKKGNILERGVFCRWVWSSEEHLLEERSPALDNRWQALLVIGYLYVCICYRVHEIGVPDQQRKVKKGKSEP